MNFLKKLFNVSQNGKDSQTKSHEPDSRKSIDLQKVFPRIKGMFDDEFLDPVENADGKILEIPSEEAPVIKPLAKGIGICYMVDKGDSYQLVQNKDLSDELTIEILHNAALTNMAIIISDKTEVNGDPNNVMMVTNGGNFEATMILADFLWEQVEPVFNDNICVAIPANDLLFISGKNNQQGRATLRNLVKAYFDNKESQGLIVRHIYERANGAWILSETV